jgi:hypothetical protein
MPQFSVSITNLQNGGQLGCSNTIDVSYTQPGISAPSTVALTTTATATVSPASVSVNNPTGTVQFTVTVPPGTNETGKTVEATITNEEEVQESDTKTGISAVCPGSPGGSG